MSHVARSLDLVGSDPHAAPMALRSEHRDLAVGDLLTVSAGPEWQPGCLGDVLVGAGFVVESPAAEAHGGSSDEHHCVTARRVESLADSVGPSMRLLVCGLNPSPHAASTNIPFSRAGNRFWPAAQQAGVATCDRDPAHALWSDRLGFTDLVKRTTRRASELERQEFEIGLERVERLVGWLKPAAVCVVGLAGWRAVRDRSAAPGPVGELGGRPVWLMPSTSGLNAHSSLADLTEHLRQAAELAGRELG